MEVVRGYLLLCRAEEVNGLKPLVQRGVTFLENRPLSDGELHPAVGAGE